MTLQENGLWFEEARGVAAKTAKAAVATGATVENLVIFVTDPYEALGFDIAVSLLVSTGLARLAAEAKVRSEMAETVASGRKYGLLAGVLTHKDAAATLSENAFDGDPQPFFNDELEPGAVRMIATRLGSWLLAQVEYED
jgi:hypothetical protein